MLKIVDTLISIYGQQVGEILNESHSRKEKYDDLKNRGKYR